MSGTRAEWAARRQAVAVLLQQEPRLSNCAVSRRLGVNWAVVREVRAGLGLPPYGTPAASREEIAAVLQRERVSDKQLAGRLGVDRRTVAVVRASLGLPVFGDPSPNWEPVARLLKTEYLSNKIIAARLGVTEEFVGRVRADLGLPVFVLRGEPWTVEAWNKATREIRGGHRLWLGRVGRDRTPMADRTGSRHGTESAYRLGFRLHYGREPVGRLLATCSRKFCVEPRHRQDKVMREAWPDAMPAGATFRGVDLVAVRRALRGEPPYPELTVDARRLAARYADPEMSTAELSRRLGCAERSAEKWRGLGAGG